MFLIFNGMPLRGARGTPLRGTKGMPLRGREGTPLRGTKGMPLRGREGTPLRGAASMPGIHSPPGERVTSLCVAKEK